MTSLPIPRRCPWCGKEYIAVTGKEQTALQGMVYYDCGTIISWYGYLYQITTPCVPDIPQWLSEIPRYDA